MNINVSITCKQTVSGARDARFSSDGKSIFVLRDEGFSPEGMFQRNSSGPKSSQIKVIPVDSRSGERKN